jgi:hypothetical protein
MYVSNILVLTVCCKLTNLVFQVSPRFIPAIPATLTSYIDRLSHLFGSDTVTISIWFVSFHIIVLNTLRRTMDYASIRNNLYSP